MNRCSAIAFAILLCAGCGHSDAPTPGPATNAAKEDWTVRQQAQSSAYDVVRAAYYYMIDHPQQRSATLAQIGAETSRPEYERARNSAFDPWGREIRLTFKSQWYIVATSAGPDGAFGTDDDLSANTDGWQ